MYITSMRSERLIMCQKRPAPEGRAEPATKSRHTDLRANWSQQTTQDWPEIPAVGRQ